jgi:polyferredoxin
LLLALTSIFIASGGIYWAMVRFRSPVTLGIPFNLLDILWVNRFISWKGFQPVLQIPTLALIAVIAYLGFFDIQDGAKNLATKLTWILWWPGIIFTFILVGRLWCVMCPFGTLNEWAANLSRPDRLFPKGMQPLVGDVLFLLSRGPMSKSASSESPQLTAWLIVIFAVLAIATGIFSAAQLCHYICPITGLLGLYSTSPGRGPDGDRSQCPEKLSSGLLPRR